VQFIKCHLHRILAPMALIASVVIGLAPAKAEDGTGFAHKVCDIYAAPIEHATFAGAGAGCTWLIGEGDIGTTRTEIMMIATRNLSKEEFAQQIEFWAPFADNMAEAPGFRVKEFQVACANTGEAGRVVFWGIPSKSNLIGYAVCGNNILHGSIKTPPDSDMDTELLFEQLMNAMVPLLK
jgi:hypothetical protein